MESLKPKDKSIIGTLVLNPSAKKVIVINDGDAVKFNDGGLITTENLKPLIREKASPSYTSEIQKFIDFDVENDTLIKAHYDRMKYSIDNYLKLYSKKSTGDFIVDLLKSEGVESNLSIHNIEKQYGTPIQIKYTEQNRYLSEGKDSYESTILTQLVSSYGNFKKEYIPLMNKYEKAVYDYQKTTDPLAPIEKAVKEKLKLIKGKITKRQERTEQQKREDEIKKLYEQAYGLMPNINKDVLSKMLKDIELSFKPMEEKIYQREMIRYKDLIKSYSEEVKAVVISENIPFWREIFSSWEDVVKQVKGKVYNWRTRLNEDGIIDVAYYKNLKLKSDYEQVLDREIKNYIAGLRLKFLLSVFRNFEKINIPIKNYKLIKLEVGAKGFQGYILFNFENGSSFIFKTEAIGAGGYNIQKYHFRYLSDFTDVVLSDGKKLTNPSLWETVQNFSVNDNKKELGGEIKYFKNNLAYNKIILYYYIGDKSVGKLEYIWDDEIFSVGLETKGFKDGEMYIELVEVDKDYRNKGIAKKLISRAISDSKELGVDVITLRRDEGMGCGHGSDYDKYLERLYSSLGFVNTWTEKDFYESGGEKNICAMHMALKENLELGGAVTETKKTKVQELIEKYAGMSFDEFMKYATSYWIEDYDDNKTWKGWRDEPNYNKIERHPIVVETFETKGKTITLRKNDEKLKYVAVNERGDILRDEQGMALYQTDEQLKAKGIPLYDTAIHAFDGNLIVGWVDDSFGVPELFVRPSHKNLGIGSELLWQYLIQDEGYQMKLKGFLGQYTSQGKQVIKKLHNRFVEAGKLFKKGGKLNPFAVCTVSVGKTAGTQKRSEWDKGDLKRYESCVLSVKDKMEKGGSFESYKKTYTGDGSMFNPYDLRMEFPEIVHTSEPSQEQIDSFNRWLREHKSNYVKLFHGTPLENKEAILKKGILPTSFERRLSQQSESGYVYLSLFPTMSKTFADFGGNKGDGSGIVFEVVTLIKNLKPDADQLANKRMENFDIGGSLAESLIYGHGARVLGKVDRAQIRITTNDDAQYFKTGGYFKSVGLEGNLVGMSRNPYIGKETEIKCFNKNIRCFVSEYTHRFVYIVNGKNVSALQTEKDGTYNVVRNVYTIENYRRKGYQKELNEEVKKHLKNIIYSNNLSPEGKSLVEYVSKQN